MAMKPKPQMFWAAQMRDGSLCGAWAEVWGVSGEFDKSWAFGVLLASEHSARRLAKAYAEEGAKAVMVEVSVVEPKPRKRKNEARG